MIIEDAPVTPADVGRWLVSNRRRVPGTCEVCGTEWEEGYPEKHFCSPACARKARAERRGDTLLEALRNREKGLTERGAAKVVFNTSEPSPRQQVALRQVLNRLEREEQIIFEEGTYYAA